MSESVSYTLTEGVFLQPTASGAYYAVSGNSKNSSQQFLQSLLQQKQAPALNLDNVLKLTGCETKSSAFEMLHHCQNLKWIQGVDEAIKPPDDALEDMLPTLLAHFSGAGKILLADEQGFYMANHGFAHETAEELSALSAEISTIHNRRSGVINKNLSIPSHAWAIVDAYGHSQIGFWPLFIGTHRFVIVSAGRSEFNHPQFINLIWVLCIRYANT